MLNPVKFWEVLGMWEGEFREGRRDSECSEIWSEGSEGGER